MAYDGRLMRRALARYDEDKQRRAENFRARERTVYTKCPRIADIDRELSHTMAKIIASGSEYLRHLERIFPASSAHTDGH